jgi:hypothetical protein
MAAGLAATAASFVTSRFGVAGTLLGAALTAMIITGGSAIFRSYLETVSGRVRGMPTKLRSQREQQKAGGFGGTMPGRPDLRDNFVGRMRAALDWFSHLPTLSRRSILIKGLLAAAVAFVICMGVVWGAEKVIGNSLSCGIWAKCPYGATPGVHPAGYGGTGAGSSISGGGTNTGGDERPRLVDRVRQGVRQERNPFGNGRPVFRNPGNGGNPGGAASSASPDPGAVPRAGGKESAPPAAGKQDAPSSASPAAGKQDAPSSASPAAGKQDAPSSAKPAAGKQDVPSSASPAAGKQEAPSSAKPAADQ